MRLVIAALVCAGTVGAAPQAAKKKTPPPKPAPPPSAAPERPAESWPVWGGPRRNFMSPSTGLANTWPKEGPPRLWSRALGDGYSAIAEEKGVLFTTYRRGSKDVVIALEAANGKTVWEYEYDAPFSNAYAEGVGPGPYAMPQVVGDRVVTASGTGKIHSLDKRTGRPAWSHDLYGEFRATRLQFGYSCHGLPYKDTLIYLAGGTAPYLGLGRGSAVVAFRQSDGAVVWRNQAFTNAHSSPLLIDVDGQPQVVALLADKVIGFNPEDGELLWSHPHPTQNGLAISTPVWADGNLLFVSSAYSGGARVLQLAQSGGKTTVSERWHNPHVQLHFGDAIRVGDYLYVSSGHSGPAFMSAVELKSGRIAWQTRDFAKSQLLHADGKLIILDEDGTLGLGRATPEGFQVLARVSLQKRLSWTPPTLVGTRLYLRDRATISALELGEERRAAIPWDKLTTADRWDDEPGKNARMKGDDDKVESLDRTVLRVGDADVSLTLDDAKAMRAALVGYLKRSDYEERDALIRWTGPAFIDPEGTVRIGPWVLGSEGKEIILRYREPPIQHGGKAHRATLTRKDGTWTVSKLEMERIKARR